MQHGGDVIEELTADHREMDDLFDRIEALPPGSPERRRLLDQLTIEMVRHSVAEEQHLYPAVREHIPRGDALADKEAADHGRVEQLLKDLEGMDADEPEFVHLFAKLRTEVRAHVQDEEDNLFAQLRAACGPELLDLLGQEARLSKESAPTRPHPGARSSPLASKILSPGLGLVDRARLHHGPRQMTSLPIFSCHGSTVTDRPFVCSADVLAAEMRQRPMAPRDPLVPEVDDRLGGTSGHGCASDVR
ncbi:hemerythrin domain-containing protein [Streptomyces sp. NPDC058770]|uniref:hemerythrin domain-containing protein n=1 Tax=Streptomyces sp. NPDC058770 TaxID=3346631 RepID=UPI0036A5114C